MAYGAGQTATAPKNNSVSNAIADFDQYLDRAEKCASRLQMLCDRLSGPRPTAVESNLKGDGSVPSAVLGSIHERRSRLGYILDEIEQSLQTLDSMI